jgi:hypothetical protein
MPIDPVRAGHSLPPIAESEVAAVQAEMKAKPSIEAPAALVSTSASEGEVFQPDVGDEVLVAFKNGAENLWNANTSPTDAGLVTATRTSGCPKSERRSSISNSRT